MGKYARSKLYSVTRDTGDSGTKTKGDFDLLAKTGDLVAVIQHKDPLGNRDSWFCDNGQSKGFVAASALALFTDFKDEDPTVAEREEEEARPVAVVAPYDEVTEDEYKKPTRKAPPVPGQLRLMAAAGKSSRGVRDCEQVTETQYFCKYIFTQ